MRFATILATILVYTTTLEGGVTTTGNSLGLSKDSNANGPGLNASIGTFITTDTNSTDTAPANPLNPWPAGTTNDWTLNRSSAPLSLPPNAVVTRAHLVWGGSTTYGNEDVSASLDTAVSMAHENGQTALVVLNSEAQTINELEAGGAFTARYYLRSSDVTPFVQANGGGMYTIGGIPATQDENINGLNAAGWSLFVFYSEPSLPTRTVSLFVTGGYVDDDATVDYALGGFCTAAAGATAATVAIAALGGSAAAMGDSMYIGPDLGTLTELTGTNNVAGNFFGSQINDDAGTVVTTGTFGTANHDAVGATMVTGARYGWDQTTVSTTALGNSLTDAVVSAQTLGDHYVPVMLGFTADMDAPDLDHLQAQPQLSASTAFAGDVVGVTMAVNNAGVLAANNVQLVLPLLDPLDVENFAVDGNPMAVTKDDLLSGVLISSAVAASTSVTVTFDLLTAGASVDTYVVDPVLEYEFTPSCVGSASTRGSVAVPSASLQITPFDSGDDGGDGGGEPGGCRCDVAPQGPVPTTALLLVLAAAGVLGLRRRRR